MTVFTPTILLCAGGTGGHLFPAESLAHAIARTRDAGLLRIDHFLHLRCEVPTDKVVEDAAVLIGRPDVRLSGADVVAYV